MIDGEDRSIVTVGGSALEAGGGGSQVEVEVPVVWSFNMFYGSTGEYHVTWDRNTAQVAPSIDEGYRLAPTDLRIRKVGFRTNATTVSNVIRVKKGVVHTGSESTVWIKATAMTNQLQVFDSIIDFDFWEVISLSLEPASNLCWGWIEWVPR